MGHYFYGVQLGESSSTVCREGGLKASGAPPIFMPRSSSGQDAGFSHPRGGFNSLTGYPGSKSMVDGVLWEHEAASSNLATPTLRSLDAVPVQCDRTKRAQRRIAKSGIAFRSGRKDQRFKSSYAD